jgi:hypothetical protein
MTWNNNSYKATIRVVLSSESGNFIVVGEVIKLDVQQASEQSNQELSERVDKLIALFELTNSIFSELGVVETTCPDNIKQDVMYARCGYSSSSFEIFKLEWDYQLDYNETLGTIEDNSPWSLNDNGVYSRYLKVDNVPFSVYYIDGGVVVRSIE